jgi:signal peptidase
MLTGFLQLRVVLTGSMKPTINPGDMVVALGPNYFEPQKGRIVLYTARDLQGNAVTTWAHRIIGGDSAHGFDVKGDANDQPDIGHPKLNDIKGVVLFTIPKIGRILSPVPLALIVTGIFIMYSVLRRSDED